MYMFLAEIICPDLDIPTNGLPLVCANTDDSYYSYGAACRFSCDDGYILVGSAKLACGGDGSSTIGEKKSLLHLTIFYDSGSLLSLHNILLCRRKTGAVTTKFGMAPGTN